jgi:hypothetical protein
MGLADVSNLLWGERELLEQMMFKLEEEQLVLVSGRTRWLHCAAREVEVVHGRIKGAELMRAAEVAHVGIELGVGANASLLRLAETIDPVWGAIFQDHRHALVALTREIRAVAGVVADLIASDLVRLEEFERDQDGSEPSVRFARAHEVRHADVISVDGAEVPDDDAGDAGDADDADDVSWTVLDIELERAAYRAALSISAQSIPRSLTEFLR